MQAAGGPLPSEAAGGFRPYDPSRGGRAASLATASASLQAQADAKAALGKLNASCMPCHKAHRP